MQQGAPSGHRIRWKTRLDVAAPVVLQGASIPVVAFKFMDRGNQERPHTSEFESPEDPSTLDKARRQSLSDTNRVARFT